MKVIPAVALSQYRHPSGRLYGVMRQAEKQKFDPELIVILRTEKSSPTLDKYRVAGSIRKALSILTIKDWVVGWLGVDDVDFRRCAAVSVSGHYWRYGLLLKKIPGDSPHDFLFPCRAHRLSWALFGLMAHTLRLMRTGHRGAQVTVRWVQVEGVANQDRPELTPT